MGSIVGVQNVMQQFYIFSGLKLNCAKCDLFSSGVNGEKLMEIQQATRFKLRNLSVRYLRVPLVIRRLIDKDYNPLIDRIIARINLLPHSVLKRINQISAQFFWKGKSSSTKGARLARKQCAFQSQRVDWDSRIY